MYSVVILINKSIEYYNKAKHLTQNDSLNEAINNINRAIECCFSDFYNLEKAKIDSLHKIGQEKGLISKSTNLELFRTAWSEYPVILKPMMNDLKIHKESFFNEHISNEKLLWLGAFMFCIFFVFRYIIFTSIWSIKQLY